MTSALPVHRPKGEAVIEGAIPRPGPEMTPVRVALVDYDVVVEGLRVVLRPHRDLVEILGCIHPSEDVASAAIRFGADVVLMGVHLDGRRGLDLARELVSADHRFKVVIFTVDSDEARLVEAIRLGVAGYLLKSMRADILADYLVRIHSGERMVDPTMATRIALRSPQLTSGWAGHELGLSQRESEVLSLLVNGLSNQAIAAQLVLGAETIKTHVRSIYKKLGVNGRAEAVATALRLGIFT